MQAEARLGLSLKKENTRPNSTEGGGGVVDSVVAGCNHGDSATKRKGFTHKFFWLKREIFFEFGKSEEKKKGKKRKKRKIM